MYGRYHDIWIRLTPAVPRHWLFGFAGLVWTAVGVMLCARAYGWLAPLSLASELSLEGAGVVIAAAGYASLFSKVVKKNVDRIDALPDRACAFAFTAWKGYIMIGLMVTLGITLRNSAIPKSLLAVPYTAMGVVLLTGSVRFYQRFAAVRQAMESQPEK